MAEIGGDGVSRGEVTSQYLYLGDRGQLVPVAKLESVHSDGNATGGARMLYVHADYRGQPMAMTDRAGQVVWHARPDTWGYVATSALMRQQAVLNLRLPGQYFDEETGLHDNWHRTYDARPGSPLHGRYLSPDPLGFPDGLDATAYVGGDPVNRVDPTGLYEEDVHYYATYFLAIMAGLQPADALVIASADRYIDDNPNTEPFGTAGTNFTARKDYHFTQDGYDPAPLPSEISVDPDTGVVTYAASYTARRVDNPVNPQLTRLLGYSTSAPTACSRDQFYGEYLHAFEDTFAHRNSANVPYGYKLGHLLGGHDPDHTYNGDGWTVNEPRTLEMEQEVFTNFQTTFGTTAKDSAGNPITWDTIKNVMTQFDENTSPETNLLPKTDILDGELTALGFPTMPKYNCSSARDMRNNNLRGTDGVPFLQSDYPGAILATPTSSQSCK